VSEAALTPITGYTWGTPTVTPDHVVIADKTSTFTLTVANSISRDHGSLVLAKTLTGGPSGYTGPFTINYNCGAGFTGSVTVSAGSSQAINGIPTGTSCTVSEPTLPTAPTGYTFGTPTFSPSSTVTIAAGNNSSVTVTTKNTLAPKSQITPTQTTCSSFSGGTSATLDTIHYGVKGSTINNVNPGVFFYWFKVTPTTSGTVTYTIVQTINSGGFNSFFGVAAGSSVFDSSCNALKSGTSIVQDGTTKAPGPTTTITFKATADATYIIGVKYDPGSVVGKAVPTAPPVQYTFASPQVTPSSQNLKLVTS
jgi:hypothetical protein